MAPRGLRQQHRENDDRFDDVHRHGRHAGLALHRAGTGLERAEEQAREHHAERVEATEERERFWNSAYDTPATSTPPASPAIAPESASASAAVRRLSILPAISAARAPRPTARSRNPHSVRAKTPCSSSAPASASRSPACSRVPGTSGNRAASAIASLWG
jgi:hypothetical protein